MKYLYITLYLGLGILIALSLVASVGYVMWNI